MTENIMHERYRDEKTLKNDFAKYLVQLGYEKLEITTEDELLANLRKQIEILNKDISLSFSDYEWDRFFTESICSRDETYKDKLKKIQDKGHIKSLRKDDGITVNVKLIDKKNIQNNKLQFLEVHSHQPAEEIGTRTTILFNGLPLVHIEFSYRGDIKSAFEEINHSWRDEAFGEKWSFFDFVEIFVITNGEESKYYSCTTRHNFIENKEKPAGSELASSSNGFFFTTYWSDKKNAIYRDLESFTKSFFEHNNIREMIVNFSVLTNISNETEMNLKVMRPYQVYAAQSIIERVRIFSKNMPWKDKRTIKEAGGYIWHATGSGKTLTSFKAARMATELPGIDKVLFVVDRKDLDHQTQKEYDTFESGAAAGIKSSEELWKMMNQSDGSKIIITTIQKLNRVVEKYHRNDPKGVFKGHMVLIFDECHRSQNLKTDEKGTDGMHKKIRDTFPNSHFFGFTGTPLFRDEKDRDDQVVITTEDLFGKELHKYTLYDAIQDQNVLKLHIEYYEYGSKDEKNDWELEKLCEYQNEAGRNKRLEQIVTHILDKFDQKTLRPQDSIGIKDKRRRGYNSILAAGSIEMARQYYQAFKERMEKETQPTKKLFITTIFSAQESDPAVTPDESNAETQDVKGMRVSDSEFLKKVMEDYNKEFKTSYDLNNFYSFQQNVSQRLRDKEIDMLIVVNMFLTGFDSPALNTLWLDKKLYKHNLIQAFSRTNRISGECKSHGNIICFRTDEETVTNALKKYAGAIDFDVILALTFDQLLNGYEKNGEWYPGYLEFYKELMQFKDPKTGEIVVPDGEKKRFKTIFNQLMKLESRLGQYDEKKDTFEEEHGIDKDYIESARKEYIDIHEEEKKKRKEKERKKSGVDFDGEDMALDFIKLTEVTVEYIIALIIEYEWEIKKPNKEQVEKFKELLNRKIDSSISLRIKKQLINDFIDSDLPKNRDSWDNYISEKYQQELIQIITEEGLKGKEATDFVNRKFRDNNWNIKGEDIEAFVPIRRTEPGKSKAKEKRSLSKLETLWRKFSGFISASI